MEWLDVDGSGRRLTLYAYRRRRRRAWTQVNALTCSTADFKVGLSLEIDSAPWKITGTFRRARGRGRVRIKRRLDDGDGARAGRLTSVRDGMTRDRIYARPAWSWCGVRAHEDA